MSRVAIISLVFIVMLSGCGLFKSQTEDTGRIVAVQEKEISSQDTVLAVEDFNNRLSYTLKRGDAELAPTYEEFYEQVSDLFLEFVNIINTVETEPEIIDTEEGDHLLKQLKIAEGDLTTVLQTYGPETEKSYEDFYQRIAEIVLVIDEAMNEYTNQ
ncbi:MAG: hypothetical protein ABH846_01040 [Patescibacteria group bacterium]